MPRSLILVVDDEPVITETLVKIINSFDGEFLAIGSTEVTQALTLIRGIHPDLVMLDVVMPGAEGLAHAIEMRDTCGCTVLLMSGQSITSDLLEQLQRDDREPFEVVAKPVHPTELVDKIRDLLRKVPEPSAWRSPLNFQVQ